MPFRGMQLAAVVIGLLVSINAAAQQCDAYFAFDGNLSDASGNGYDGRMLGREGAPATPQFVEGRTGQALALDGTSAMRAFVDLHHERCPQVSFSAWLRIDGPTIQGSHQILSSGLGRSGPGLRIDGASLTLNGTENGLTQGDAVRPESGWMFIAGVYDYTSSEYTLYWRNRSVSATLSQYLRPPREVIWVGALDERLTHAASNLVIDDLRIYGRALGADEVLALAGSSAPAGGSDATAPATALASGSGAWQGSSCSTHAQCPSGSYCGRDGQCHPDQHAPMQEAPRGSGISATTNPIEPGSTIGTPRGAPLSGSGSAPEGGSTRPPVGVSQLPEDLGDPDLASRPRGAPDLTYESEEAAQEAAEQRRAAAEAQAVDDGTAEGARTSLFDSSLAFFRTDILVFSGVSGGAGDYTEQMVEDLTAASMEFRSHAGLTLGVDVGIHFPYWIETRENFDKPCTVYVHKKSAEWPVPTPPRETQTTEVDVCEQGLPRVNPLTTLYRAFNEPSPGEFEFITGIQVCNNGINNRVKGIRARVRSLRVPGGTYSPNYSTRVFEERSNCSSWQEMVHCGDGTVAVGLRLHFRDGDRLSPRDFLSGIELICGSVEVLTN